MAPHSHILAWEIPWTEEPGGLQSMGLQESDTTWRLNNNERPTVQASVLYSNSQVCGDCGDNSQLSRNSLYKL